MATALDRALLAVTPEAGSFVDVELRKIEASNNAPASISSA
jgi:hypothetical protein